MQVLNMKLILRAELGKLVLQVFDHDAVYVLWGHVRDESDGEFACSKV